MKQILILICMILPILADSQVHDDFSDGDFIANPAWTGDTGQFEVSTGFQLHLDSEGSDTSILAVENHQGADCEWNIWVKLSFNTSTNNYCRIYLVSDLPSLKGPVHGYYLQLGGSHDSMAIFRQDGAGDTMVFRFPAGSLSHSANTMRFRIIREDDDWNVGVDTAGGGNYVWEGAFSDDTYVNTLYFGIFCRYTSSNSARFWFDDIHVGPVVHDTLPPVVVSAGVIDDRRVEVLFSEPPGIATAEDPVNYTFLRSHNHPVSATSDSSDNRRVILASDQDFPPESCDSIFITGIADVAGNLVNDTIAIFCIHHPAIHDILMTEIMADPTPAAGLPEKEYLELFNRSGFQVDLAGWTLEYGTGTKEFPGISIMPGGFLILACDTALSAYGKTIGLFTSGSSLSNEGMTLTLRDDQHRVIHSIEYTNSWYEDSFKEDGGWSLEMVDPGNPCGCRENWAPSKDGSGGTPGRINSTSALNSDTAAPRLDRAVFLSSNTIRVLFSETADSSGLMNKNIWTADQGKGSPDSVTLTGPGYRSVCLIYQAEFDTGTVYEITCNSMIYDCAGNAGGQGEHVMVAIPRLPGRGDAVISEILPEPHPGGSRYFEIYNNSVFALDLRDLMISYTPMDTSAAPPAKPLSDESFLFFPGEYVALCSDDADVKERYYTTDPGRVLTMESFPVFSSKGGGVSLVRKQDGELIDEIHYDPSVHHPLISEPAGVSLEKISLAGSSADPANWHSASASSGYGTPGYRNSQFRPVAATAGEGITLTPEVFSPDNDGRDDLLVINITLEDGENAASISIFNSRGQLCREIVNSSLMGPENIYLWDGITFDHRKSPPGIYYIYAGIINSSGETRHLRKTFAVAFSD